MTTSLHLEVAGGKKLFHWRRKTFGGTGRGVKVRSGRLERFAWVRGEEGINPRFGVKGKNCWILLGVRGDNRLDLTKGGGSGGRSPPGGIARRHATRGN